MVVRPEVALLTSVSFRHNESTNVQFTNTLVLIDLIKLIFLSPISKVNRLSPLNALISGTIVEMRVLD